MIVDALHLNLFIYQHSEGNTIKVPNFQQPKSNWIVHLKFSHNNIHCGGNHYDAIVCQCLYFGDGLQFLTDVATKLLSNTQPSEDEISLKSECQDFDTLTHISDSEAEIQIVSVESNTDVNTPLKSDSNAKFDGTTELYSCSDETYVSTDVEGGKSSTYPNNFDFLPPPPTQLFSSNSENTSLFSATTTSSSEDLWVQSQDENLYVQSQDEDLPDSFEIESLLTNIAHGKPFPAWFFEGISPKFVSSLSEDINGTCFYKIKVKGDDWHRVT